jgi:predicted metalloprotease with PDZ domain
VSLETLIDSPVLMGQHFRVVPLANGDGGGIELHMACDGEAGLALSPEMVARYQRLVAEADGLFGSRHFRRYRFLLTLSDHTAHFGLEHHESSDNRVAERSLIDPDLMNRMAGLLPHEYVHSLGTANTGVPMGWRRWTTSTDARRDALGSTKG